MLFRGRYGDHTEIRDAIMLPVSSFGLIRRERPHLAHEIGFTPLVFALARADDFEKEIRRVLAFGLFPVSDTEERVGINGKSLALVLRPVEDHLPLED